MVLADHYGVIDLGASNSIYGDQEILAQAEKVLSPYPNVVLLLPSANAVESALILKNRLIKMLNEAGKPFTDELFELNEYFIQHPSNRRLAKLTIYTKNKTPDEICGELVGKLA